MESPAASSGAIRWGRVAGWYACAMAGSMLLGLVAYLLPPLVRTLVFALSMFAPSVAVVLTQHWVGEPILPSMGVRKGNVFSRWTLVAAVLPAAIAVLWILVSVLLPGVTVGPANFIALLEEMGMDEEQVQQLVNLMSNPLIFGSLVLGQGVVAGSTINAVFALGEEAGWRGWLLRELAPLGFWRASCLVGLLWGFWHWPHILLGLNFPEHPLAGIPLMAAFCALLSPSLTLVCAKTQSVFPAAIFHGCINAIAPNFTLWIEGGSDLTTGLTGMTGLGSLALVNACIFACFGWQGVCLDGLYLDVEESEVGLVQSSAAPPPEASVAKV